LLDLELSNPADAVFSTATFHWITDHERLFQRVAGWLRPGGRLEAQCGGEGNIASFLSVVVHVGAREPYVSHLAGLGGSRLFAGAEETSARLRAAGFAAVECGLEPAPEAPPEPRAFAETVCLGPVIEALPQELVEPFLNEIMEAWGPAPTLDYVRLNISAQKGPAD
ncbi:MAG TPA: methyltransferase domain-containing protein, partial [Solirubrobacterales bacterium]|nr:methyltransferase domain-containing protein [Solirubrobacterales bacterium]